MESCLATGPGARQEKNKGPTAGGGSEKKRTQFGKLGVKRASVKHLGGAFSSSTLGGLQGKHSVHAPNPGQ